MYCSDGLCSCRAKVLLQSRDSNVLDFVVTGTSTCSATTETIHHSTVQSKDFLVQALREGLGPTEAYEECLEEFKDENVTKAGVKTMAARRQRKTLVPDCWPRDTMLCLVLLRQTQRDEISSDEPVRGYIQVSNGCLIVLFCTHTQFFYISYTFQHKLSLTPLYNILTLFTLA